MFVKFMRGVLSSVLSYWAMGFVFLIASYSAAGFLIIPLLLRTELPAIVANELQGAFRVADVRFNPFSGTLELEGVALDTSDGQPALAAERILVDVALWESLHRRTLLLEGFADQADIRVTLDAKGMSNWSKLGGRGEPDASSAIPLTIGKFALTDSRLYFKDESNGAILNVSGVNADLHDLGPDLALPAGLNLHGSSGENTKIDLTATLKLSPLEISGTFRAEKLDLKLFSSYLQSKDIVLMKGLVNGELAFEYRSSDDDKLFSLRKSKLSGQDILGHFGANPGFDFEIAELRLDELEYDGEKATLGFWKAGLKMLGVSGLESVDIRVDEADIGKCSFDFQNLSVRADSAGIREATVSKEEKDRRIGVTIQNLRSNGLSINKDSVSANDLEVGQIALEELLSSATDPQGVRIGKTAIQGIVGDIGKRLFTADRIDSADAQIQAWISVEGMFEMPGYSGTKLNGNQSTVSDVPWTVRLNEVAIHNYQLGLTDRSVDPPVSLNLADMDIRVSGLDTRQGKFTLSIDTSVGKRAKLTVEGGGTLDPPGVDLRLHLADLNLGRFKSYLKDFARIDLVKGRLNVDGDLVYRSGNDDYRFNGTAEIAGLVIVDRKDGRDFINWQSLRAEGLALESTANRLSIRELIADKPYARVVVDPDRTLNLIENLFPPASNKTDSSKPVAAAKGNKQPLAVTVGALRVQNGSADFSDLSLQPNVSVDIHGLAGVIRPLSSRGDVKAEVLIKGSISDAAPVTITGRLNPFQLGSFADVNMRFANVDLTELSPYSAKFAGYQIDKGKVDMDLHYRLSDRDLVADNNMVFDRLTLGERVDSPEATSLPVKFAISLMRGLDGKIDINLPISGNLDDPKFSVMGLLGKAAVGVITKVISSPFAAIGLLMQGGSDDAGSIRFAAGSSSLENPEKARLDELAVALAKRPGLSLEIRGTAQSAKDAGALAEQQLRRQLENAKTIEARIGGEDKDSASTSAAVLSDDDYRRLFSQFYRQRYPGASEWAELPKGERILNGAPFESARQKVLKDWSISDIDLRRLAQARGAGIRNYLVQKGIEANRIYLLDVELSPSDGATVARLSLS